MKKLIVIVPSLILILVVLGPVLAAQLDPPAERDFERVPLESLAYEEVRFVNSDQDIELAGMLFIPEGEGPFPAVVVIHGSGTSARQNSWDLSMVRYLQAEGIVVLLLSVPVIKVHRIAD